jgi:hypothetical protein
MEDDQSDATVRISSQDGQRVINRAPRRFCNCNERQVSTDPAIRWRRSVVTIG